MDAAGQLRLAFLLEQSGCEVVKPERIPGSANISDYVVVSWASVIGFLLTKGLIVRESAEGAMPDDPCQLRLIVPDREAS